MLFNIESKINPVERNQTRSAGEFVAAMAEVFLSRGEDVVERITHQSFDVRLSFLVFPLDIMNKEKEFGCGCGLS